MKVNIFSKEWCDIVFAAKNKDYGAYKLRRDEDKNTVISILIGSVIFVTICCFPFIKTALSSDTKENNTDVIKFSGVKLDIPKAAVKEIELKVPAEVMRKTLKFTEPVITHDPVKTVLKTMDSLNNSPTLIASVDNPYGTDDPNTKIPVKKIELAPDETLKPAIYVEQMPAFPGGEEELMKFIKNNVQYPKMARETGITGKVIIRFVVDKDGRITNVELKRSIGGGCDEEAMRVVKMMPRWNPGKQNGNPVPVYYVIPFNFFLN